MYNLVGNEQLREKIRKANSEFSYTDVFESEEEDIDIGATAVITSSQIVTIVNIGEEKLHYNTQNKILQAIYDLPDLPVQIITKTTREYEECRKRAITFTIRNISGSKIILIEFPKRITEEQLKMLRFYKRVYGQEIDACAQEYYKRTGERLIGIKLDETSKVKENGFNGECESFEEVIRYARSKKKTEVVPKEKFIVGYQEESIRKNADRAQKSRNNK